MAIGVEAFKCESSGAVKRQSSPQLLLKVKWKKSAACTIFYMLPPSQKKKRGYSRNQNLHALFFTSYRQNIRNPRAQS
jgi:hypothetical protein